MALGSGLPGAKLETLPQRMPDSHMRLGRVTPALREGVVMLRLLAGQTAGPLGPRGDPDVVCFQLVASRSGRRRLSRPQGGTKGPPRVY